MGSDGFEAGDALLVDAVVEQGEIVMVLFKDVLRQEPDHLFGQIHVVGKSVKRHFRLHHPELGKMTGRIGVFCAERRSEGIDLAERERVNLSFKLAGHREPGLLAEKVFSVIDISLIGPGRFFHIERGDLKQRARAFTVARGYDGRMHMEKTALLEKTVDGEGKRAAQAGNGTERVGARP